MKVTKCIKKEPSESL